MNYSNFYLEINMKPLMSIYIPAYNNIEYTRKTIASIIKQSYRPIELIILDDASPSNLRALEEEFMFINKENFKYIFIRNEVNLNSDNPAKGFNLSTGKYVMNMPHDDHFLDNEFLSDSINILEANDDCNLVVGNSIEEFSSKKMLNFNKKFFEMNTNFTIVDGKHYLKEFLFDRMGTWAHSGVIWRRKVSLDLGLYKYPLCLGSQLARNLGTISDEFVGHLLLASTGKVAITNKIVSLRGKPNNSFCNNGVIEIYGYEFQKVINQGCFIIHYNLLTSSLKLKYKYLIKIIALKQIYNYKPESFNIKILDHLNYKLFPSFLYISSYSLVLLKTYIKKLIRKNK